MILHCKLPKYFLSFTLFLFLSCCGTRNKLDHAEEFLRQEKYDQAIDIYKNHMRDRLSLKNRPEWENPYFYYLLIGDIELRRSNVEQAMEAYYTAQKNNIHISLISDRMRYVAGWYEEQGKLEEAIEVLKEHRKLDPLLFDAMLDRISKEIIRLEDLRNKEESEENKTIENINNPSN